MDHSRVKPSYPVGAMLRRLLENAWHENRRLFGGCFLYTMAAAVYPFLAVVLPKLILQELEKGAGADAGRVFAVAGGYFVLAALLGFLRTYVKDWSFYKICGFRMGYLRDTCTKVMEMAYPNTEDASFMQKYEKAFIATQANDNGVEGVYHKLFESPAVWLATAALSVFIGALSPWVLLGLCVNLAAVLWVSRMSHAFRYSRKAEEGKWYRKVKYYSQVTHDFTYGKDIRMYGMKQRVMDNYKKQIQGYRALQDLMAKKEYRYGFVGLAALLLSDVLTYGVLIGRVLTGMSIADFSMYLTATVTLSSYLKQTADSISFLVNEGQYVDELFRFLDEDMGEKGGSHPAVTGDTLEVVFDDVSFHYPGSEKYIFRHLNLTIHKGERLAIVGINGAGKSTLVKLMMGLFDVTEGEIRINGIPLKEFDKKALYSMFSAVFQEVNVMAFTVRENVAGRLEGIDDARVDEALRKVGLEKKIQSLPKGTHQMMLKTIEEDGALLSGGESQKLAIARALYKDACMVVMDEPTAALDALAEAEIYENFSELVKGKTAVYISHRLASTKFCDHIALFDGDGLKEYGTHEELMAKHGSYYEMFTVQGKYYTEGSTQEQAAGVTA